MLFFLLACIGLNSVLGATDGVLSLDKWTFDKVVGTGTVLVKFDKEYAYGGPEDEFKELAKRVGEMGAQAKGLVIAEVGASDYGEKKNADVQERFSINKDDYPVFKLFKADADPVSYTGEVTADNLVKFLRTNAGVWIGAPGCLEAYDKLATDFMATCEHFKPDHLEEATALMEAETEPANKVSAKMYVKIMNKVIAKGDDYVATEVKRVNKMKDGKISDKKKEFFNRRLNVLSAFAVPDAPEDKKEL